MREAYQVLIPVHCAKTFLANPFHLLASMEMAATRTTILSAHQSRGISRPS
jgi:hypothetical protein